jgi:endo-1,4-beta-mannosidase
MRFGVNYTPSQGWFHSWLDFDVAAVARDLDAIAGLGVDHIRIFPLWHLVQPNRTLIRPSALDDVACVLDLAAEVGLEVNVDGLQGHLSSYDFMPSWLESWHRKNMFTHPLAVSGEVEYLRALTRAVADRPNLLGITLGNEVNQFAGGVHPTPHTITPEEAGSWLGTLDAAVRTETNTLVTHAMYDASWYRDDQPFLPEHAADYGDSTVVHSWVFNGSAQLDGPLAPASVRHAQYLLALAAAWNRDAERPVWLQEVGAPINVVPVADVPEFISRTVRHAMESPKLWGITWWCSHDVSRSLADFPPLEYDLGLIDSDGNVKPSGRAFAELIKELRDAGPAPAPEAALELDDSVDGYRAQCAPGGAFHRAWMAAAEHTAPGQAPQIVLRSRRGDQELLAARGISDNKITQVLSEEAPYA